MATSNDVTNYEYQDLRNKIQENLKNKQGWGDSYESSVGQNLIDIAADAADILSYMLERRSQESFQSTARLRSSVAAKSSELGYRSRRAVASTGKLNLQLNDENGQPKPVETGGVVFVERGTEVLFDNETFIVDADYTIEEGNSSVVIDVTQGTRETIVVDPTTEETFINNGYIIIPNYEYIDERSLRVVSNNVEYQDIVSLDNANGVGIGSLSFAPSTTDPQTSSYYDVRYAQDGMRIQFGDDLFGQKPSTPIEISFIRTDADAVRVLSINKNFAFNFDVFGDGINVVPANVYEYELTNQSQIIGGRPPETLNEIRVNSPLFLTTNNRAVSLDSYSFWAKRSNVGGLIDARAYAENEMNTLLYNMNNIYISYLTETGVDLIPSQKQDLIDYIKERDVALAHIVPKRADEIRLGLEVELKRDERLRIPDSDLFQVIRDFLLAYYDRSNGSIGRSFQKSDLIRDFYKLQTRVAGIDFDVTDFVDININAYQEISVPTDTSEYLVRLNSDGTGVVVGDVFSLNIDGTQHSVTVENADLTDGTFSVNMLFKMRDELYASTDLIPTVEIATDEGTSEFILYIKSRDNLGNFVASADSGDFVADTVVNANVQIFLKEFNNIFEDILLRGSINIINTVGDVLYVDFEGGWLDIDTGTVIDTGTLVPSTFDMINYIKGTLTLPPLVEGNYIIKYKQDRYDNFKANNAAAVTLIEPKLEYDDLTETFTTITFIKN